MFCTSLAGTNRTALLDALPQLKQRQNRRAARRPAPSGTRVFAEYRLRSGKRGDHALSDNGQYVGDKPWVAGLPPKIQRDG